MIHHRSENIAYISITTRVDALAAIIIALIVTHIIAGSLTLFHFLHHMLFARPTYHDALTLTSITANVFFLRKLFLAGKAPQRTSRLHSPNFCLVVGNHTLALDQYQLELAVYYIIVAYVLIFSSTTLRSSNIERQDLARPYMFSESKSLWVPTNRSQKRWSRRQ